MSVSVFAERLRNAMNSRGLKQVDLVHAAEHRGVKMGKSHISQYVAGKTMPREDVLEFLASELDVDTNWLRGEESTTQLNSDASNSVTDGEHAATPLATGASKPQTDSEIPVGRRRTFGKSHKLDNVLYDVRGPVAAVVGNGAGAVGQRAVRADVIGQHQRVFAHGMLKVEVHPL